MASIVLIVVIIALIPAIYLLHFWVNSDVLSDIELRELAIARRFWDTYNYLDFTETQFEVNKAFKSTLNKNGQLYNCNEQLKNFPSIASALLKGKKHEWVIFAFARNKIVFSFYTNKGNDNQSVAPNLSANYITKIANDNNADMILQFHNHPNAVLSASQQDLTSANYFGKIFTSNKLNFLAFVSCAGRFYQYGFWLTETFYNMNDYLEIIRKDNGISRSINYDLRKELKRKKYFMNAHLNNSSTNITLQMNQITSESKNAPIIPVEGNDMDYLSKVLNLFDVDLKNYPKQNYSKIEKMTNMGDGKNETWNKYYYTLTKEELV